MCRLVGTSYQTKLGLTTPRLKHQKTYPSVMRVISHIALTPIIGKISQDNTDVHEAREDTSAETADLCWGLPSLADCLDRSVTYNLGEIDWPNDNTLSNPKTSNQASSIDSAQIAAVAHEDGNAHDPEHAPGLSASE